MPLEQLTTPPVSPSPTDGPNFAARAFAFLNWWYTVHGPELNEWITAFNNQVSVLDSYVDSAETFANAASASAGTATTQAGIATTKAADAAAQVVLAVAQVELAEDQVALAAAQAGIAAAKATEAATSETNASNSATASANSAVASDASKDDAETAAGTATTQAGIATTKAGEAATSKTGADTAAATATTQAGIATTKASEAATSKTGADTAAATATTKASEAATSKTGADTAATTATTQAGISTTQAGIATTQAGIATTKAGEAATSAATAIAAIAAVPTFLTMGIPPIDTMPSFQWRPGMEDVPYNVSATRASTATRINEVGLIEQVANDIVRIDHDPITGECLGALCEEARTNLLTYSENFDNAAWTKTRASITPNAAVAPDGTMTADKFVEDTTASSAHFITSPVVSFTSGLSYTYSIMAKPGERNILSLSFPSSVFGSVVSYAFTLSGSGASTLRTAGTGNSATIKLMPNGCYFCSVTAQATSSGSNSVYINLHTTESASTYSGDGTSGLYIWGAQLEAGAFPTSYVPSSVSFTSRASTATYVGSGGLIKSAAIDAARMNYNPTNLSVAPKLLVEAASTNLLTYSEDFSNAAWTKTRASITPNAAVAPDGTMTADKLVEDTTATNSHFVFQDKSITAGSIQTMSVYVKAGERSVIQLNLTNVGSDGAFARFDLSSGVIITAATILGAGSSASSSIVALGNGWYRCILSCIINSTSTTAHCSAFLYLNGSSYTGDGTSGLYIWGAQLESGNLSSYIPTTTAAVTRAADVSSSAAATRAADVWTVPVSSFTFNKDEGTVYASVKSPPTGSLYKTSMMLHNGATSNSVKIWASTPTSLQGVVTSGGSDQAVLVDTISAQSILRYALAYATNNVGSSLNGGAAKLDTSATLPSGITTLQLGAGYNSWEVFCGHIRHIAYFPRRISDSNLQLLTA